MLTRRPLQPVNTWNVRSWLPKETVTGSHVCRPSAESSSPADTTTICSVSTTRKSTAIGAVLLCRLRATGSMRAWMYCCVESLDTKSSSNTTSRSAVTALSSSNAGAGVGIAYARTCSRSIFISDFPSRPTAPWKKARAEPLEESAISRVIVWCTICEILCTKSARMRLFRSAAGTTTSCPSASFSVAWSFAEKGVIRALKR
mmetsp:Transcript_780/g.2820  ORF Transcript_780/g.2820 Transcript_780/m.2820 type:complete len:202 (-) Transcript_780:1934-2539(-)